MKSDHKRVFGAGVKGVAAAMRRLDIDVAPALAKAGIDLAAINRTDDIPFHRLDTLVDELIERTGDYELGLRVAQELKLTEIGEFGYLIGRSGMSPRDHRRASA